MSSPCAWRSMAALWRLEIRLTCQSTLTGPTAGLIWSGTINQSVGRASSGATTQAPRQYLWSGPISLWLSSNCPLLLSEEAPDEKPAPVQLRFLVVAFEHAKGSATESYSSEIFLFKSNILTSLVYQFSSVSLLALLCVPAIHRIEPVDVFIIICRLNYQLRWDFFSWSFMRGIFFGGEELRGI